jgi:hypothetical protein
MSPAKVKLGCCKLAVLVLVLETEELADPVEDGLRSIQGTATCFPEELKPEELIPVLEVDDDVPVLEAELPLNDSTANSSLPEAGFKIVSLIVPISVPDEPVTWAPVSWLPRTASCPMRPVALKCRPDQPDWLLEVLEGLP